MFKKLRPIALVSLVIGMFFTCCKKDPQINPPEKVITPPPPAKIIDSIFPNPCNVSLTISTNSASNQTIKMVDMLGRIRIDLTINQTTVINTDSLQAGVYYITIINSAGTTTHKVIVQH